MTEVTAWCTRPQVSVQNATETQQRHLAQSRTGLCRQCPIRISGRRPLQSEAGYLSRLKSPLAYLQRQDLRLAVLHFGLHYKYVQLKICMSKRSDQPCSGHETLLGQRFR